MELLQRQAVELWAGEGTNGSLRRAEGIDMSDDAIYSSCAGNSKLQNVGPSNIEAFRPYAEWRNGHVLR